MELTDLSWRKSSHSMGNGGNCVQVADAEHFTYIRDSKRPDSPTIRFPRTQWMAFVTRLTTPAG